MYFTVSKELQFRGEKEETKAGRICIRVLKMNSKKKFETIWEKVSAERV